MKKILALILSLAVVMGLCACGSDSAKSAAASEMYSYAAADYDTAYYEEAEEASYGGFAANDSVTAASGAVSKEEGSTDADINPEKIIYSANTNLETTAFDDTVSKLNELIASCGGFVESSSVSGADYYSVASGSYYNRSASYTIRVPSSAFSGLMESLSTLGNIPYTNTYTDNITSRYYDTQARLDAYKTQETRLLEMMEIAETVEDIITIEDRLTELRYEIESLQSTLNNWDRQVSYSTIYLNIEEVREYTEQPAVTETYGQRLARAAKQGLEGIADFFADFLVWFVEALPTLVILGIIAWIAVIVIRGWKKKKACRAEKRENRKAEKAAKKTAKVVPTPIAEVKQEDSQPTE